MRSIQLLAASQLPLDATVAFVEFPEVVVVVFGFVLAVALATLLPNQLLSFDEDLGQRRDGFPRGVIKRLSGVVGIGARDRPDSLPGHRGGIGSHVRDATVSSSVNGTHLKLHATLPGAIGVAEIKGVKANEPI
jgi:hypothetical protein